MSKKTVLKPQIHPRIEPNTFKALKQYCKAKGVSESQVVNAAIKTYLDDTKDMTLIFRRLDQLKLALAKIRLHLDCHNDAFGIFCQLWFAHTPEIAEWQKDAARRLAWDRYQRFCESVAAAFNQGRHFIADVMPDPIADDTELAAAVDSSAKR